MQLRKATTSDKKIVLNFCKTTFSWGDYISDVWDSWLSEGHLLVISDKEEPIAICHASIIKNVQVWIEGIRVKQNLRRKGFAKRLIKESELIAKNNNCKVSKMLIESNNIKSLNLADSLNYKREEKWNFYSLLPKKFDSIKNVKFANYEKRMIDKLFSSITSYVRSWRWVPLTNSETYSLIKEKKIIFSEHEGIIDGLVIYTESDHFEKTLMLTLACGHETGIRQTLKYIQNLAYQMHYKRIQILTKIKLLPKLAGLEKRFSFYLMKKEL